MGGNGITVSGLANERVPFHAKSCLDFHVWGETFIQEQSFVMSVYRGPRRWLHVKHEKGWPTATLKVSLAE